MIFKQRFEKIKKNEVIGVLVDNVVVEFLDSVYSAMFINWLRITF